jgi:hypothetical protein
MLDETKLFDFIKLIFTKHDQYRSVKNHNKKRHQFMINRFFAIKFPANANALNLNGINPVAVVDGWAAVASRFRSVPGWIYTKTKKSTKAAKSKNEYIPSDEAIKFFLEKNEIGKREFKELELFAKEELHAQLKSIESAMKVY